MLLKIKLITSFVLLSLMACTEQNKSTAMEDYINEIPLVDYVNPLMGTDSTFELSNGNTYPAIATPWGMNFWTPMTSKMGDGWTCLLYTSPSPRDRTRSRMPSSA